MKNTPALMLNHTDFEQFLHRMKTRAMSYLKLSMCVRSQLRQTNLCIYVMLLYRIHLLLYDRWPFANGKRMTDTLFFIALEYTFTARSGAEDMCVYMSGCVERAEKEDRERLLQNILRDERAKKKKTERKRTEKLLKSIAYFCSLQAFYYCALMYTCVCVCVKQFDLALMAFPFICLIHSGANTQKHTHPHALLTERQQG